MPAKEHPYDAIASDLFDWMQGEVDYHVQAMQGGYRAPFSAETSEADKLEYYRRQVYKTKPNGDIEYESPNPEGRDKILKQYGTQAYAEIMNAVKPKQGIRPAPEMEPQADPLAAAMPPMPEDEVPVEPV
jgi:hypothetical protein